MSKVGVLTTTKELLTVAHQVAAADFNSTFEFYPTVYANVVQTTRQAIQAGCEVIVARKGMYSNLRKVKFRVPIVYCSIMQGELLRSLSEAKAQSGLAHPKICFLNGENELDRTLLSIELSQKLLATEIMIIDVDLSNRADNRQRAQKEIEQGADILVASATVYEEIKDLPACAYCISGSDAFESIANAYRIAEIVAESIQAEKLYSRDLKNMLEYTFEAVLLLNQAGEIMLLNHQAKKILTGEQPIKGQKIWTIFPQMKQQLIQNALHDKKDIYGV